LVGILRFVEVGMTHRLSTPRATFVASSRPRPAPSSHPASAPTVNRLALPGY
jgi:hypothetical protein